MRRRRAVEDVDERQWLERCAGVPDSVAVYVGGRLIGFNETAAHEYLAEFGDEEECGEECRAAGHLMLL